MLSPDTDHLLSPCDTGRLGWLHPLDKSPGVCWGEAHSLDLLLQVDQSGLFLPSRDYYLNRTANEKVRSILRTPTLLLSWADACLLFPLSRVIAGKVSLSCLSSSQPATLPSFFPPSLFLHFLPPSLPAFLFTLLAFPPPFLSVPSPLLSFLPLLLGTYRAPGFTGQL